MDEYRSSSAPDPSVNANPALLRQLQNHTTAAPRSSRRHGRSQVSSFAETGAGPDLASSMRETVHGHNIRFGRHPMIPPIGQRNQHDGRNFEIPHEATTTRRALQPERPAVQYTNPDIFHQRSRLPHRHDDKDRQYLQTATTRPARHPHAQGRHHIAPSIAHNPAPVLLHTLPLTVAHGGQTLPTAAMHTSYLPIHPMSTAYPMFPQVPSFYHPLTMPFLNPYNMTLATNPLHYAPPIMPYPVVVHQGLHQPDTLDSRLPEISELSPTDPNADYETGEAQRQQEIYLYEDYYKQLVLDKLTEEVCRELIDSCLPDCTREVVNSCIDDIVRSYLLLGRRETTSARRHRELKPLDCQPRKPVKQIPETNNESGPWSSILARGHPKSHSTPKPKMRRPRSNSVVTAGRLEPMERSLEPPGERAVLALHNPNVWQTQGNHNKVMRLKSNPELSRDLAEMVLNELLFCELLEAACDGGLGMMLRTQAQHIMNDLMFTALLEQIFSEPH